MNRGLHEIKRDILKNLSRRMKEFRNHDMKFGYTFIERSQNGSVENAAFEPFDSFECCCAAAEHTVNAKPENLERVEIVPCEYDGERCHPQVMSVLKTLKG